METSSPAGSQTQPAESTQLGRYVLSRKIGAGGMGAVYLARDTVLERDVALKVLPKDRAKSATLVKRFKKEAQAAAGLRHENIVAVYDFGEESGHLYIALEFIPGTDVQILIRKRGMLPIRRSLEIIRQVAKALHHAHERGIVHRDIKPSNLLIGRDGVVKLTDMGLARTIDESLETSITRVGTTVGTVDYMAPEQAQDSKAADIRSDLYSLGCTWYHMLAGTPPFVEGSMTNKLFAHANESRPDPRDVNPNIPEGIFVAIHKLMSIDPKDRYQTPKELLDDLEALEADPSQPASPALGRMLEDAIADPDDTDEAIASTMTVPNLPPPASSGHVSAGGEKTRSLSESAWLRGLRHPATITLALALIAGLVIWGTRDPGTTDSPEPPAPPTTKVPPKIIPDPGKKPGPKTPALPAEFERTDASKVAGLPFGRNEERPYIPQWVSNVWPVKQTGSAEFRVAADNKPNTFRTIGDALDTVPTSGGLIRLESKGPHVVASADFPQRRDLTIVGTQGNRPMVVLSPSEIAAENNTGSQPPLVDIRNATLTFSGVHLIIPAEMLPRSGRVDVIRLSDANLVLHDCIITIQGRRNGPVVLARVSSKNLDSGRVLLRDTFVRGPNLTAVELAGLRSDVVIYNCNMATGDLPLVEISLQDEPVGKAKLSEAGHIIAVLSSNLSSTQSFLQLGSPWSLTDTSPVRIATLFSRMFTGFESQTPSLVVAKSWPIAPKGSDQRYSRLRWLSRDCLFSGWQELLRDDKRTESIDSSDGWKELWRDNWERNQFQLQPKPPLIAGTTADPKAQPFKGTRLAPPAGPPGSGGAAEKTDSPGAGHRYYLQTQLNRDKMGRGARISPALEFSPDLYRKAMKQIRTRNASPGKGEPPKKDF